MKMSPAGSTATAEGSNSSASVASGAIAAVAPGAIARHDGYVARGGAQLADHIVAPTRDEEVAVLVHGEANAPRYGEGLGPLGTTVVI